MPRFLDDRVNPPRPVVRDTRCGWGDDDRTGARLSAGDDERRVDEWYHREYRQVVSLVYTLSGSRTAAEELTQDAFLEAHRRWGTISDYDDPGGWVRKVAMNKARSSLRRRAAEARAYAKHLGRERALPTELPESSHEFWAAVRALPTKQAQVVALHYLEDRPVDDIADVLDVSPGTVKTHLHRGRQNLAASLGHEEDHR